MAKQNLTMTTDIQVTAREIDFVTRFARNWDHLREILGIMRPIKKQPGAVLKSKTATVELQSGDVAEGEDIPYSKATVKEVEYQEMKVKKYSKAVSIEAINEHGYDNAVARTDEAFLYELQNEVTDPFFQYLNTGSLTASYSTFQMAMAMAKGLVINEFKKMHRTATGVVGFVNVLDVYEYIGAAEVTVQNQFGFQYLKDFMGYNTVFLMSEAEIKRGRVIATPVENLVLYYIDPASSEFSRAGLQYTTDGETNLIGFHTQGNYNTAVSECFAIMGMTLFAEYLSAIAVVDVGDNLGTTVSVTPKTATVKKGETQKFTANMDVTWTVTGTSTVASGTKMSTDGTLTVASGETNTSLTVKATSTGDSTKTGTATVTVTTGE